eukprot:Awhi_evm1s8122
MIIYLFNCQGEFVIKPDWEFSYSKHIIEATGTLIDNFRDIDEMLNIETTLEPQLQVELPIVTVDHEEFNIARFFAELFLDLQMHVAITLGSKDTYEVGDIELGAAIQAGTAFTYEGSDVKHKITIGPFIRMDGYIQGTLFNREFGPLETPELKLPKSVTDLVTYKKVIAKNGLDACDKSVVDCGDHGSCGKPDALDGFCFCGDGYSGDTCEIVPKECQEPKSLFEITESTEPVSGSNPIWSSDQTKYYLDISAAD